MESLKYELIIIISNKGFADEIMDTAKEHGARGGTIIHGRGTAAEETIKFFGLTIQPEKELILIVSPKEVANPIMKAVSSKHGTHTKVRALCFSLPVSNACGFNF